MRRSMVRLTRVNIRDLILIGWITMGTWIYQVYQDGVGNDFLSCFKYRRIQGGEAIGPQPSTPWSSQIY